MLQALDNLEKFLYRGDELDLPALLHCGLVHAQFETIHPFLDGNGRVGRLLITFLLVHRGVLHRPLLYLSHYLKRYRAEYYDRLMALRLQGDWEGWLKFLLRGVAETAEEATATARAIVQMREQHRRLIQERRLTVNSFRLLDLMFQRPILNVALASGELQIAFQTANSLLKQFERLGLLRETTGAQRSRRYAYVAYLDLFSDRAEGVPEAPIQATESAGGSEAGG